MNKRVSPNVKFNVINNNVYPPVPMMGISHVIAVTEKGPIGDASTIVHNINQFHEIYGSETVPDGSISNIEIALLMGSSLRISRVDSESGDVTTSASWIKAHEALQEYDDAYQVFCSCLHQHLTTPETEESKVHKAILDFIKKTGTAVYYIEIPKYSSETTPMTDTEMKSWKDTISKAIGKSQYAAYFGGGFKYYDEAGTLQNCDTLGTIIGLGDASAKKYGPWYQFSGQRRGVVYDADGIVVPNYGSLSNTEKIGVLAEAAINLSVIKNTRFQGKQVMLWHNFTDLDAETSNTSEKYLGVVRLIIYLKKVLRPILENYLEEPNTFETWKHIYYEVRPLFEDLVNRKAITEGWVWNGDQDADRYEDMVVNNEADVRNGKYKAQFVFKEIIGMQEIVVDLVLDKSTRSVTVKQ